MEIYTGRHSFGGTGVNCNGGCGTVFKMTLAGVPTTLHSFNETDGSTPVGTLIQASDGNFYGTTLYGGGNGGGTVFKITPGGAFTTLYSFCSHINCTDGGNPFAGLLQGKDGNFYGVTASGGNNYGVIFSITPAGLYRVLYSFSRADGASPSGSLVQSSDGSFYGTTARAGTIFQVTPEGVLTTLGAPGGYPYAGLVQATDGSLYGTGYTGNNGYGSVFEFALPQGPLTTLYNFCFQPNCADGLAPLAGLVQGTDGKLYGTTSYGGASASGTAFSLDLGLIVPGANLSPTSLDFGAQGFLRVNTPQNVTLTNNGLAPLLISDIIITGTNAGGAAPG